MMPPGGQGSTYRYVGDDRAPSADGWESLGDMGHLDSDGYLYLGDRKTDMILCGGANVFPAEVESAIDAHAAVRSSAVIGLPDAERGERVCAVVETTDGAGDLTQAEMVAACAEAELMVQKVPEQLVVHDGPMPRNATMKVLKYELKDALAGIPWP